MNTSRLASIVVVILALLVTVHPAAAAHTVVVSSHTTDADFSAADTLSNVTVEGSGTPANVRINDTATSGVTWSYPVDYPQSIESGSKYGFVIKPKEELAGVNITISSQTESTTAYIQTESGTTLDTDTISGDQAQLEATLKKGVNYRVVVDGQGSNGRVDIDESPSYPYQSDDIEVVTGARFSSSTNSNRAYAITDIEAVVTDEAPKGTYISQNHTADNVASGFTNITLANATATVTWQGTTGSSWSDIATNTRSSSGNYSVSLPSTYDDYRVNVTYETSNDEAVAKLHDEGVKSTTASAEIDNSSATPSGGQKVSSDPTTLSINVTDSDLGTVQGDSVDVKFVVNGNVQGTDTLTANGTAEFDYSANDLGTVNWYVWANDSYGHSQQSQTFQFETPSALTLRNETNASDIISGQSITATFYGVNGQIVVEKTDSDGDGNISLSGLPNQAFVVTVESNGWHDRRVYIDSIYDQEDIYLLNSTVYPGISTTFVYEDRTGEFEQSNTTLVIERAVDPNNDSTYDWEVIAGDYWGAAGEFPFTGEYQARYRLRIVNQETGQSRLLGTHIPTDDGIKNIIVGRIIFEAENGTGRYVDATINSNTSNLQILYVDPSNKSTDVHIVVHEQGNASNEIFNQTYAGPLGEKVITQSLTSNQTNTNWVVEYDVGNTADGPKFMKVVVGGGSFPLPIDGDILSAFAYVFITFVMALYGPRTALLGAWAGVFVFAGFAFLGWISGVTVAVPVLIAIGATFYNEASP